MQHSPLYLRCCRMGMMVSSGILWARNSCHVLYCSNVSQSSDWTVKHTHTRLDRVYTQGLFRHQSRVIWLQVDSWYGCRQTWAETDTASDRHTDLLRMLSTESLRNITRFPIITWHISSWSCERKSKLKDKGKCREIQLIYYLQNWIQNWTLKTNLCGVDDRYYHV